MAIVDGVASLTLVTHRIRIAHVESSPVTHETLHGFVGHLCLIEARKGSNLDLWLVFRMTTDAKRRRC